MSNYGQLHDSHNFSHGVIESDYSGAALLWLFVAAALLAVFVLVGSYDGQTFTVGYPGDAGATTSAGTSGAVIE